MINQGKIWNYLLYAIGEIFLVVIGILIAVNIGSWEEEKKYRAVEISYFTNLKKDLFADIIQLDSLIKITRKKELAAKKIKVKAKKRAIDSLYHFSRDMETLIFVSEFFPHQNTYNEMQNSGNFSLIQNEEIKIKLMNLNQTYTLVDFEQSHNRNDYKTLLAVFEKHVNWANFFNTDKRTHNKLKFDSVYIENNYQLIASDIRNLLDDKTFVNSLLFTELNHGFYAPWFTDIKNELLEIVDLIDKEIERN
jgi:hypothetical protein